MNWNKSKQFQGILTTIVGQLSGEKTLEFLITILSQQPSWTPGNIFSGGGWFKGSDEWAGILLS